MIFGRKHKKIVSKVDLKVQKFCIDTLAQIMKWKTDEICKQQPVEIL